MRDNGASVPLLTWLAPTVIFLGLLWMLSPILAPFMCGAILAYICNPLVARMESKRIPRSTGTALTLLLLIGLFAGLVLILVPLVQHETNLLIDRLPAYLDSLKLNAVPWLQTHFGVDATVDADKIKAFVTSHLQNAGNLVMLALPSIKSGGLALIGLVTTLLLVPVVLFYVLRDWGVMLSRIEHLIPRRWHAKSVQIGREIDQVLSEFLRGQIAVMLVMSVYYVAALHVAGLEFALPIGLVTGLLVFIPYLGMATGLILAVLVGLIQFQGVGGLLPMLIAFGIGQLLEGMVVTPFLVGERIGLHPVAVIFALLAFGQLFGFFGILLALPVSAALLVGLRHLRGYYLNSVFYKQS
jgi:predicted PurR-regulated permease PerM